MTYNTYTNLTSRIAAPTQQQATPAPEETDLSNIHKQLYTIYAAPRNRGDSERQICMLWGPANVDLEEKAREFAVEFDLPSIHEKLMEINRLEREAFAPLCERDGITNIVLSNQIMDKANMQRAQIGKQLWERLHASLGEHTPKMRDLTGQVDGLEEAFAIWLQLHYGFEIAESCTINLVFIPETKSVPQKHVHNLTRHSVISWLSTSDSTLDMGY